jgi:3-deoxy-7-phosphoheptulonate synthase
VILRGGSRTGPNYSPVHVAEVCARLGERGYRATVMVDCSHGNSVKNFRRQPTVAEALCEQVASGSSQIFGAMIESHLCEGRQELLSGVAPRYGQSITDACLSFADTKPLLERFALARRSRRAPR